MEVYITHDGDRFYGSLRSMYFTILASAESVALLHVSTKDRNNSYYWKHFCDKANSAITNLREMLPIYDKRRDIFKLLVPEDCEKRAIKLLETSLC